MEIGLVNKLNETLIDWIQLHVERLPTPEAIEVRSKYRVALANERASVESLSNDQQK